MDQIVKRLHENRQIELAKSILESAGYKVTKGEDMDEGLFGLGKKKQKSSNDDSGSDRQSKVTFKVYDGNGTLQFNQTFDEIPGKMSAEEQMRNKFKSSPAYRDFKSNNPRDWSYERVSNPASSEDTKNKKGTQFLSDLGIS